ncbi:MAG: hypothetical protein ACYDB8_09685, partial [Acidiferrobacterales bacterium]
MAILCVMSGLAAADGGAAERLLQLRTQLRTLQHRLDHTRGQRDSQREALRDSERQIGALLRSLRQLDAEQRRENGQLARHPV